MQADLDDPSSLERAFEGAYGVFALTDFWEHGAEGEIRHGKNMVDAAKKTGVRHFVYSTLDRGDPEVPHFVTKAVVDGTVLLSLVLSVVRCIPCLLSLPSSDLCDFDVC